MKLRGWMKWTLGIAAAVVGVVALRVTAAYFRRDAAPALPPVPTHGADVFGDPLPEGAIARIGTIRWRARGPAVWAPDGEHLIVGGWDEELLAMNVRTGLVDWTLPGHAGKIALNIELRDLPRIAQTGELPMVDDSLRQMVLMPGGHRLLTAGHSLRVWDLDTRTEVKRIPIHSDAWPMAVSPDGTLAACSWNTFIRVIDLASGARKVRVDFGASPTCVAFDRDGSRVVAGFNDGRVGIARLAGGDPVFVKVGDGWIHQILVPGDGHAFWAVDMKGVVTIRSIESPDAPSRRIERTGAEPMRYIAEMVVSPDGRTVAVSWGDEPIRWLDANTAERVAGPTSERELRVVGWSPDGRLFAAQQGDAFRIFGGAPPSSDDAPVWPVGDVAFSPDGKSVALQVAATLRIADAATGSVRTKFDADPSVSSIAWTRDGATVALGMRGPRVVGVDAATGRQAWTYDGERDASAPGTTARLSADATTAWWVDATGAARVVDLRGGKRPVTIVALGANDPKRGLYGLASSADGRRVAVVQEMPHPTAENPAGTQTTLRAWNIGAAAPFVEIPYRGTQPALSRDGRFASYGELHSLAVFDLDATPPRETGRAEWTIRDRASWHGPWTAVAFSPDAARLAVGDVDGIVHVFALPSCAEVAALRGHRAGIASVAFSDDGSRLVSGSADMTALVWDLTKLPPPPAVPAAK